ncbi:MAG: STAS domain-containing protein [Planctomycetaceae bacterium]|jgi:anti-anti-sigma factor|nr:STAS domain-containing protein [Planctomycetaceae bacterium]
MTFETDEDTLRCVFTGDLDTITCNEISKTLINTITVFVKDRDVTYLVFDLTDVRYICSAFLRLCLYHCKQVGTRNFRIENPSIDVNRVLQIAGFPDVMTIV